MTATQVFIVTSGSYESTEIVGAFSTSEKAQAWIDLALQVLTYGEEFNIIPRLLNMPPGLYWEVDISPRYGVNLSRPWLQGHLTVDHQMEFGTMPVVHRSHEHDEAHVRVIAQNKEEAERIAGEQLALCTELGCWEVLGRWSVIGGILVKHGEREETEKKLAEAKQAAHQKIIDDINAMDKRLREEKLVKKEGTK